jgi:hypothetical protein
VKKRAGGNCGFSRIAAGRSRGDWSAQVGRADGRVVGATLLMQADIRYFQPAEILHAWHRMRRPSARPTAPCADQGAAGPCYERRHAGILGSVAIPSVSPRMAVPETFLAGW